MKKIKNINFHLKKLSIEEIETYLRLNDNHFFRKLSDRLDIRKYSEKLHENALHFTLYDGDQLVGFSPCYFNDETVKVAYISALIIKHDYRGLVLTQQLLEHIKAYAEQNNFNSLYVKIHCDNKKSVQFYKDNAFNKFESDEDSGICTFEYKQKTT